MAKRWNIAELKAGLSECIREVERGQGVLITRHGRPVAALVPPGDLERLLQSSGVDWFGAPPDNPARADQ